MFTFPGVIQEVRALEASNAKHVLLTNFPPHLFQYVVKTLSLELKSQVSVLLLEGLDSAKTFIQDELVEGNESTTAIKLEQGGVFVPEKLIDLGLERVDRVWSPGEFSLYGDVCVIWQYGYTELIRISLFDDVIEQISLIKPDNRRKLSDMKSLSLDARMNGGKVKDMVVEGIEYETEVGFSFIYVTGTSKFELKELGLPQLELSLKSIPLVSQCDISTEVLKHVIEKYSRDKYEIKVIDSKRERYDQWSGYVKNMSEYVKLDADQLSLIPKGYIDEHNNEVVLTAYEVFSEIDLADSVYTGVGARTAHDLTDADGESEYVEGVIPKSLAHESVQRKISGEELFKKIVPGDFIVHEDHGIGRYLGIVERLEGVFIAVEYSGKDRLYVPLSQSKKVTKYIGGGNVPKLTSLNSGAWRRIRKRAAEESEALAKELLRLYAIRKTMKVTRSDMPFPQSKMDDFIDKFEFHDTEDQMVTTSDILRDLKSGTPMDRLLVGDVGFGKTEVAMRAMYAAVLQGQQVAFLAPTTVLVEQHRAVLEERFAEFDVNVGSLSRFLKKSDHDSTLEKIEAGKLDIIIGTHSLLSKSVKFKDLGLVVIDEEQKFGVKQKEALKEKRLESHILSMTATPIPRTLNMALSGIRDISMINTPPHGRKPIMNYFEEFNWEIVNKAIAAELERGGQVYFVHNRVRTINEFKDKLEKYFPDRIVEVVHGQMSGEKLASIMYKVGKGVIDILVTTTIIENGIDFANVNTLIVHKSEMFGLAQLYQIRGRVGRSTRQAYAYFLHKKLKGDAGARMEALQEAGELGGGFIIASRDMEIRGVGELLGREQSGAISSVGYGMFISLLQEKVAELKERDSLL